MQVKEFSYLKILTMVKVSKISLQGYIFQILISSVLFMEMMVVVVLIYSILPFGIYMIIQTQL